MSHELTQPLDTGALIIAFKDKVLDAIEGWLTLSFCHREPTGRPYVFGLDVLNTLIQFSLTRPQLQVVKGWIDERLREKGEYIDFEEVKPGEAQ